MNTSCMRLSILLAVLIFTVSPLTAFGEPVKIGYFKLPPHSYNEGGTAKGAAVDYFNTHIAGAMGVTFDWDGPHPVPRLMAMLEKGKIKMILLLAKNKERAAKFDYPDQPYFYGESSIAVAKANPMNEIGSVDDLSGMKLGFFNKGFIHPVLRNNKAINWQLSHALDYQAQNLKKVAAGRLDAAYDPETSSLKYGIAKLNLGEKIKILTVPGTRAGMYCLFTKSDQGKLLALFNKAHAAASGVNYMDLVRPYLK
ncbi:MAG: transporter substrate-binding domain-containing protein [Desulfobacterales bacterium]|nr:transporter substrate-binding domain-containing protein [Desulfobacterales bacterium]